MLNVHRDMLRRLNADAGFEARRRRDALRHRDARASKYRYYRLITQADFDVRAYHRRERAARIILYDIKRYAPQLDIGVSQCCPAASRLRA